MKKATQCYRKSHGLKISIIPSEQIFLQYEKVNAEEATRGVLWKTVFLKIL